MVWPAIIAAAGMLGSSAINYASQQGTNDKSIELWREQAAYNTPLNQMARYQAAGLNPNLVVSQGNPGNMASTPSLTAPRLDIDPSVALQLDATLKNMREQNKNLQSQNELIQSQKSVADANAQRQRLENDYFRRHGQWPSVEGGYAKDAKSLINFFSDFFQTLFDGNNSFGSSPGFRSRGDWR